MLSMIARTLSCRLSVGDNSPAQYSSASQDQGLIVNLSIVSIFSPKRIVAISDIELLASMQRYSSILIPTWTVRTARVQEGLIQAV